MGVLILPEKDDPKVEMLKALGDISDIQIGNNDVLVAIYLRSTTTTLGGKKWIMTDNTVKEDENQSKVGLIIKMGPQACVDPTGQWFNGIEYALGDWVFYRPSDGWLFEIADPDKPLDVKSRILCRMLKDTSLRGKVTRPGRIW